MFREKLFVFCVLIVPQTALGQSNHGSFGDGQPVSSLPKFTNIARLVRSSPKRQLKRPTQRRESELARTVDNADRWDSLYGRVLAEQRESAIDVQRLAPQQASIVVSREDRQKEGLARDANSTAPRSPSPDATPKERPAPPIPISTALREFVHPTRRLPTTGHASSFGLPSFLAEQPLKSRSRLIPKANTVEVEVNPYSYFSTNFQQLAPFSPILPAILSSDAVSSRTKQYLARDFQEQYGQAIGAFLNRP